MLRGRFTRTIFPWNVIHLRHGNHRHGYGCWVFATAADIGTVTWKPPLEEEEEESVGVLRDTMIRRGWTAETERETTLAMTTFPQRKRERERKWQPPPPQQGRTPSFWDGTGSHPTFAGRMPLSLVGGTTNFHARHRRSSQDEPFGFLLPKHTSFPNPPCGSAFAYAMYPYAYASTWWRRFACSVTAAVTAVSPRRICQCETAHDSHIHSHSNDENDDDDDIQTWHYEAMDHPERHRKGHAIFDSLWSSKDHDCFRFFNVYRRVPTLTATATKASSETDPPPRWDDHTSTYVVKNGWRQDIANGTRNSDGGNGDDHDYGGEEVVIAKVGLGRDLVGHPNVIHGGILALIFDDAMGYAHYATGLAASSGSTTTGDDRPFTVQTPGVTANLRVDFRLPLYADSEDAGDLTVRIYHLRTVGRKIYLRGVLSSGKDETKVYAEAQSLYIWLKQKQKQNQTQ